MTDTEIQAYIWAMTLVPPNMIIKAWDDFIIANQLEADKEENKPWSSTWPWTLS